LKNELLESFFQTAFLLKEKSLKNFDSCSNGT